MPGPSKHRSGCSQSANGWITGLPMEELEKVPKELKGSARYNMTEMFSQEDFTMVKNPGKDNMEIITKEGEKINRYTPSEDSDPSSGKGKRVGVAYELENGDIIYVPE